MSFTFTTEVTKKQFEDYLFNLNDGCVMGYRKLKENGATLHLYYDGFSHIGTWQSPGHGVIFEKILFDLADEQTQASRVVNKNGQLMFKEGVNVWN